MPMIALWIMCSFAIPDVEPPAFFAANEELRAYLLEAGENHPGLRARHQEWLAAVQKIPQVTSLDDPMFTYGQFLQSDMSRFKLRLAQKFPWFGTLRTRGEKATAEADAALTRFYAERNRVFADVKQAYFDYAFLGESIEVTQAQTEILNFMEEIVRSKYAVGMASQDDLLRVQIEQTKLRDRYAGFVQMRPALAARLNEALGRQVSDEAPWPQAAAFPPAPPAAETILTLIHMNNPELKSLDHLIESRRDQIALAKKKGNPDFTVGLEYLSISRPRKIRPDRPFPASLQGARRLLTGTSMGPAGTLFDLYAVANYDEPMSYRSGGDDNIMISLTMNVPIWRKRIKAGIAQAKHLEKATEHDKRRRTLGLDAAARMALFGMDDGLRRYDLFEDSLIPQARQTYESLRSDYASGARNASFLDLLDSVQTLLAFELEQVRAARDLQIAAADLEFLMGGPWISESPGDAEQQKGQ